MCACNVAGALFKGLTSLLRYGHIRCKLGQVSSCMPGFWPRLSTNPQTSEGLPGKARRNTSWDHLTYCSCCGSSDKPCSETVYKITQVTLAQCTASLSSPGWEVLRQHTSRVDNAKMHLQGQQRRTRCPKHAVVSNISRTSWELLVLEMTSIMAQIERCSEHIFASPADEAEQHTQLRESGVTGYFIYWLPVLRLSNSESQMCEALMQSWSLRPTVISRLCSSLSDSEVRMSNSQAH